MECLEPSVIIIVTEGIDDRTIESALGHLTQEFDEPTTTDNSLETAA